MKKSILISALAAQTALGADSADQDNPTFQASHEAHTGFVRVNAPPRRAFQLFTVPGEKQWVPHWDPRVLSGGDGRQKGAVFTTTHGNEATLWVVVDFDSDQRHARYARISPESRAGTVEVRVRDDGQGGSLAEVTYELTALTEAGNRYLADFGTQEFARMIEQWEELIGAADIDYESLTGSRED